MEKALIAPSILSADMANLERDLRICEEAGADSIHVDVMDGRFVPNLTFGAVVVDACRRSTSLPLDCHLMMVEPEKHIEAFIKAGANWITVHYETCPHIHRTLQQIRSLGAHPGVTVNPGTGFDGLRYLEGMFDMVLIMSVNPGFGGQAFIPSALSKIRDLRAILDSMGSDAIIQVDGGIDPKTIGDVYAAGGRNFVAGTAVFKHPDGIAAGIQSLRDALGQ